jgi:hypothetical protein
MAATWPGNLSEVKFSSACLPHWLVGLAPTTATDFGVKMGARDARGASVG